MIKLFLICWLLRGLFETCVSLFLVKSLPVYCHEQDKKLKLFSDLKGEEMIWSGNFGPRTKRLPPFIVQTPSRPTEPMFALCNFLCRS